LSRSVGVADGGEPVAVEFPNRLVRDHQAVAELVEDREDVVRGSGVVAIEVEKDVGVDRDQRRPQRVVHVGVCQDPVSLEPIEQAGHVRPAPIGPHCRESLVIHRIGLPPIVRGLRVRCRKCLEGQGVLSSRWTAGRTRRR
jgi:hypothetical protein